MSGHSPSSREQAAPAIPTIGDNPHSSALIPADETRLPAGAIDGRALDDALELIAAHEDRHD